MISHDRWFLDRIATHILAFEGDSHVEWFEGNYEDYEKDRKKRMGADADQPHRIKYRRIDASVSRRNGGWLAPRQGNPLPLDSPLTRFGGEEFQWLKGTTRGTTGGTSSGPTVEGRSGGTVGPSPLTFETVPGRPRLRAGSGTSRLLMPSQRCGT